jgi:hypothetical protein
MNISTPGVDAFNAFAFPRGTARARELRPIVFRDGYDPCRRQKHVHDVVAAVRSCALRRRFPRDPLRMRARQCEAA